MSHRTCVTVATVEGIKLHPSSVLRGARRRVAAAVDSASDRFSWEEVRRWWSPKRPARADDASDDWGQHGGHGGAGQEGAHDSGGLHESHADGNHHNGGPRVGDDSTLHAGEVTAPHHRGQAVHEHGVGTHLPGHDAPVDSSGHKLATPPG